MKKKYVTNILTFGLILTGLSIWQLKTWIYSTGPLRDNAYVVVNKGSSSNAVATALKDDGIIDKPQLFKIVARFMGLDKKLKAGEYNFQPFVSLYDVIQKLTDGDVVYRKITLAEGLTSKQMLDLIADEEMLSGSITIDVKDGELLPETYTFTRGDSKDSIILQAKKAMELNVKNIWDGRADNLPLKNINELVVLASIIEKETAVDTERRLVASVFVNRLIKGMRLQTDPTVIYAITLGKIELNRSLTRKDLSLDSPYNTYKYYGLPPTPICNPGKASLEAAANPEVSNYLYFVADGNGGHNFAKSLKEHNANVRNWKKIRK